eukprot:CAMPEP_0170238230 /NCGR_PEP_ID=MMETSP0116_2-20130129/18868_1 /TAXON_ID=400756 /ORGANISM="Durinskia baltica, Strain CSIRO CS-38" /LENGTH=189 /DNA_ID=CAMNT_0010489039 /DNA_START=58 /DNA_END=627 /DNA_ORIENTATION=-
MWSRWSGIFLSITCVAALLTTCRVHGFVATTITTTTTSTTTTTKIPSSFINRHVAISSMSKEIKEIKTEHAPAPVGPYSQALLVGTTLYCSGSLALDPKTGEFVGAGDIQAETRQVLKNMGAVLEAAGASPKNVVRCTIFLADLGDFGKMNEIYSEFFKDNTVLPTRTCVQAGALPKGALVEIDCIAEL